MTRLRTILARGLGATEAAWPGVRMAFGWMHRSAAVLRNRRGLDAAKVRRCFRGLRGAVARHRRQVGEPGPAISHSLKVTRGYWPGMFAAYDAPGLERMNNDLEQLSGSCRHHERRCSGREVASPGMVVRGSVRIVSATATRLGTIAAAELVSASPESWRSLRSELVGRQEVRTMGRRSRRDPRVHVRSLEPELIKGVVPSWRGSDGVLHEGAAVGFAFVGHHQPELPFEVLRDVPRRASTASWRPGGWPAASNTVAKLMHARGIRSRADRRFVRTSDGRHDRPVADNVLAREFYPARPDTAWAADITYIPTAEGWVDLAAVIGLSRRREVGRETADHPRAELPVEAVQMAPAHRRPTGDLLRHGDRDPSTPATLIGRSWPSAGSSRA